MAVSGAQPNPSGIAFHFTSASRADSLFSRSMDVPTRHAATGQDTPEWHSESRAQPRSKCCLHPMRRVATALMVDPAWAGSAPRSGMDTKKRSCGGQAIAVPGKIAAGTSMQVPFRGPASAVSARRGFRRAGWGRRQARDAITRWQCRAREQRAGALPDNRVRAVVARAGRRACRHFTAAWGPSAQRTVSLLQAAGSCGCGPAYRTTAPRRRGAGRSHAWSGAWPATAICGPHRTVFHRGLVPVPTTNRAVSPAVMAWSRSTDAWPLPHGHAQCPPTADRRRLPQALDGLAHPHRSRRCVAVRLGARVGGWVLLAAGRHADPPDLAGGGRLHWAPPRADHIWPTPSFGCPCCHRQGQVLD